MLVSPLSELNSFPPPELSLTEEDLHTLLPQLQQFLLLFRDGFARSEARGHLFSYLTGLLSPLQRKSAELIALALPDGDLPQARALQRFLADLYWNDPFLLATFQEHAATLFSHPKGSLIVDESGFQKKGTHSAGVARQYCGNLGKVENCQVGVFLSYASHKGYGLIDKRLFLPEVWFGEDYEDRRIACQIPEEISFRTKPQLALEMLKELKKTKRFEWDYVEGDSLYGNSWEFVEGLEKEGEKYLLGIPSNVQIYLSLCEFEKKRNWFKEGSKAQWRVTFKKAEAVEARKLAENLHEEMWSREKVSEGTKGTIEYEFARFRVFLKRNEEQEVWLLIRRTLGAKKEYRYFISNASREESLKRMVEVSGHRWSIEQTFEEMKSELGMKDYEARKYSSWNHHMFCCMLAHLFLSLVRQDWAKKGVI